MILALLQARFSSSRLPGKVLKLILGKPMLQLQIERVKKSKRIDRLIVVTSNEFSDDAIEKLCNAIGVECFRGSLDNVLERFYQATQLLLPEHVVRLTGDCPLTDHRLIDDVISFYLKNNFDYVSNALVPSFPGGLDVEIFSYASLDKAWQKATLQSEKV